MLTLKLIFKLRKSNNIELVNSVIIFDEAHNVEKVCEDSASGKFLHFAIKTSLLTVIRIKIIPDN